MPRPLRAGTIEPWLASVASSYLIPSENRVITVREAARIQGFPDKHRSIRRFGIAFVKLDFAFHRWYRRLFFRYYTSDWNEALSARRPELVDHISPERRSWLLMSRVKGKDYFPRDKFRRAAHAMGLRFRLHRKDLPGNPDLVFPKHRVILLVHGCFWHRHEGCKKASTPKTRQQFWQEKFRQESGAGHSRGVQDLNPTVGE